MAEKEKKKTTSKKSDKKLMDVAKPGKTAPSASSRPIIVGHKPVVKDPMVSEESNMPDKDTEEHKIEVKRTGPKVIAPLSSAEDLTKGQEESSVVSEETPDDEPKLPIEESAEQEVSEPEATPEESGETSPDEPAEETEPEEETGVEEPAAEETPAEEASEKSSKDKKDSKDKSSSVVDAVADRAAKNKEKKDDKKNEELQKRLAEVEKLVDDKKYFVKTSSTTRKERKTRWVVLLASVLLLAVAYLVLDAQLIKNDYWLPYHFFKEEKKQDSAADTPANMAQGGTNENTSEEKVDLVEFVSKESGLSFMHPDNWTVKPKVNNELCGPLSDEFEKTDANGKPTTDQVECEHFGSVLIDGLKEDNEVISYQLFTNSPLDLDTIYNARVDSLSSKKHEKFETTSGLGAVLINQPTSESGGMSSSNLYIVELDTGTYLWMMNEEWRTGDGELLADPSVTKEKDLRKYSEQVRDLIESVKYSKP